MSLKKWNIAKANNVFSEQLHNEYGIDMLSAKILTARGYDSFDKVEEFLYNDGSLSNPFTLKDMDKAVEAIQKAVENEKFIVVYGDYDCDGMTSTAMLTSYLSNIGANVSYYIPPRKSGYGLSCDAIKKLHDKGVDLIITVDNGISAVKEVDYANSIGLDIVITDHHTPSEVLPNAVAVVNPHRADCQSMCKNICGVGVALKLICALENDYDGAQTLYTYGAFAAIGTIADIVDLSGENREIVKVGLERLREGWILGINYLCEVAKLDVENLSSTELAYMIIPRINAAGRVGSTIKAVKLLLEENENEARKLACEINDYNIKRKETEQQIYKEVLEKIKLNPEVLHQRVLVLSGEGWHSGVTGIVAAKLSEKFAKPCFLFSIDADEARASCRSIEGYNIIEAIGRCSKLLTKFGGHNQAAGLSLPKENLPEFTQQILDDAKKYFDIMPLPSITIDAVVSPENLTIESIENLKLLEPFGEGNPVPVFAAENVAVEEIVSLSNGKHTKIKLTNGKSSFYVLCFGVPSALFPYEKGKNVRVAFTASINSYNGNTSVSLKLKDIHSANLSEYDIHIDCQLYEKLIRGENLQRGSFSIPTREDMADLYRYIRKSISVTKNPTLLLENFEKLGCFKISVLRDILLELGLIYLNEANRLTVTPNPPKVDMDSSLLLKRLKSMV